MFSLFKKKEQATKKETLEQVTDLKAYISGTVIPIEEVKDEVFASKAMGDGIGIIPDGNTVTAPCAGVISVVMSDTKHAVGITLDNGAELLIHEGLDTVDMGGEGFRLYVKEGDKVKTGDRLLTFDPELIRKKGLDTVCVCVLTNSADFPDAKFITGIEAVQGKSVIMIF